MDYDKFILQAHDNPFIQAAFNEIKTNLQAIEFDIFKKDSKGNYSISNSYEAGLVRKSIAIPNNELTFTQFIEAFVTYMMFGSKCLLFKTRGLEKDIHIYSPEGFQVHRDEMTLMIDSVRIGGKTFTGNQLEQFRLVKNFDPLDALAGHGDGRNKLRPLASVCDLGNNILTHNNAMLKNGGSLKGFLWLNGNIQQKTLDDYSKRINDKYAGPDNAGKIFIAGGIESARFEEMGVNPKDLDWVKGMLEVQKIVCRVMGVPESLLISENSSYNNLDGFKKKVYQDTVIPFARFFCEQLTALFREDLNVDEEIYFETSKIKCLQADISDEIGKFTKALDGKISINNFIVFINDKYDINIPLLPKELGDKVLVASNMTFLDNLIIEDVPPEKEGAVNEY